MFFPLPLFLPCPSISPSFFSYPPFPFPSLPKPPLLPPSHKDEPGFYLRQVSEPSLTDPSVNVMLCQYLTLFENGSILMMEVTYMDGENCVSTSADPLWMQTLQAVPTLGYPVSPHTQALGRSPG